MSNNLLEYGPYGNSKEIYDLLTHILDNNMQISNLDAIMQFVDFCTKTLENTAIF